MDKHAKTQIHKSLLKFIHRPLLCHRCKVGQQEEKEEDSFHRALPNIFWLFGAVKDFLRAILEIVEIKFWT